MTPDSSPPGIYLYKNDWEILCQLRKEDCWDVLDAMIRYVTEGSLPDFTGRPLPAMAWTCVRPHLDNDIAKYTKKLCDSEYANYCKTSDKNGIPRMEREDWMKWRESGEEQQLIPTGADRSRAVPSDAGRLQNININSKTKTTTNTEGKVNRGSGGKGGNHTFATDEEEARRIESIRANMRWQLEHGSA